MLEMQMQQEPKKHTPTPWRIHKFRTSLSPNEDRLAIRCIGKSMTGRDWTAYVESADGTTVLQTDGATEEEAIANAKIVLRAVGNHDALIKELTVAYPLLQAMAPLAFHEEASRYIPGGIADKLKAWIRDERVQSTLSAAQE